MSKQMFIVAFALALTPWLAAEPAKTGKPAKPPALPPAIEINASTPSETSEKPSSSVIELEPIGGQRPEKLSGLSTRRYSPFGPFGPYGTPAGPGRAWPDAAPPGAPGPAGGLYSPAGMPMMR